MVVDKKPNGGKSRNLAESILICYNPRMYNGWFANY